MRIFDALFKVLSTLFEPLTLEKRIEHIVANKKVALSALGRNG